MVIQNITHMNMIKKKVCKKKTVGNGGNKPRQSILNDKYIIGPILDDKLKEKILKP